MKLISKKELKLEHPVDVYDIENTGSNNHNFCLGNGVVVHNCAKNPNFVYTSEEIINILSAIGYDPKLEDPLSKVQIGRMICLADGDEDGCVSSDTKVILCNGTIKSIDQLAKDWEHTQKPIWVWSLDAQGNLHPAQAFDPSIRCYREKEVHVYLDSGDKIVCTLKHPFAMNFCSSSKSYVDDSTGIKYVEAQYLKPGDSIMSAYFKDLPLNGNKDNTNLYRHADKRLYSYIVIDDACINACISTIQQLIREDRFSEEAYDKIALSDSTGILCKYSVLNQYINSKHKINALDYAKQLFNNHKVVKVEIKELKEPKPFYCLTVPKYHNFLLADKNGNGICSSNCHINTLLLTLIFKVAPELFEKGMVYIADMPDFYATYKDQVAVGNSVSEVRQKLNAMKAPKSVEINHIKGWGEIDSSLMKALAVDKATRKLIKIKALTDHDRVTFIRIMNDDVAYRRQMLGLSENV